VSRILERSRGATRAGDDETVPIARQTRSGPESDAELRARLLGWFEREQRVLPWRASRDPYRVWISETMLQQTRVEVVVPYFLRFVERFPTVAALASAPVEDVLAHWSGLGYYRRARSLHAAAREIVSDMDGVIPRSAADLVRLPGVGPYTAGAVASIAFDEREPLVDGNVARVLSRLFAIDSQPSTKAFREATWSVASRLVRAGGEAGAWNQALMELGALVCTPRDPVCDRCPVRAVCRAHSASRVNELPRPKPRSTPIDVVLQVLVVRSGRRVLLEQRPSGGRMAGMWQLPTIEISPGGCLAPPARSDAFSVIETIGEIRHTITRHRIRAHVCHARLGGDAIATPLAWVELPSIASLPRTGMTRKIAARGWLTPPER
jgi:A/G-specific adenine glycosylase